MAKAKRIKGIKCNSAAPAGIKLVLLSRFQELNGYREAALDWTDPEGVHSMRVASRRLRGALRDFMPYLRKRPLVPALKRLKKVADSLGYVRDQDVAILAFEEMVKHAPASVSPALAQFIEKKKAARDKVRNQLQAMLDPSVLQQLEQEFIARVDQATALPENGQLAASQITFVRMSRAIILQRLKELEKLSIGLLRPFEIETLHDMRIAAKRLRYAVELFQQCWGRSIATYAKRAARLQTALGDVHDCDVWMESLSKPLITARKQRDKEQMEALMWLLSHLMKLRTKHLRQAFTRWREWEKHDTSEKLRALLTPKPDVANV